MAFENTNNYEAMKMDHEEAARIQACTRYVTGDLSGTESAAFEEHFFTCSECAEELKTQAVFAGDVRAVFHEQAQRLVAASPAVPPQTAPGWLEKIRLAFALPLAAAAVLLLGLVFYQNAISIPGLRSQVAELSAPQSLPWVPLKIARGPEPVVIPKGRPFWIAYFDLPPAVEFPAHCDIESSRGAKLRSVTLAAPSLGQPSSLLLRSSDFPAGNYKFKIRGPKSDSVVVEYSLDISPE
jgi:hypothetical protein